LRRRRTAPLAKTLAETRPVILEVVLQEEVLVQEHQRFARLTLDVAQGGEGLVVARG
jgi:hypothetical protein